MWTYINYRWPTEAVWLAALAAEGWQDGAPPDVAINVSGVLYNPPVDEETPGAALPGWHVSAAFRDRAAPSSWGTLAVAPPPEMPRLSAGSTSREISASDFLGRFTPAETVSLWSADPRLMVGALKVASQGTANLDSPEAAQLMALAVAKKVLTTARAAEILA